MNQKIHSFQGKHRFLSNSYPAVIAVAVNGRAEIYPSVENAYQALKSNDPKVRLRFQTGGARNGKTLTARQAKRAGKKIALRDSWNDLRYDFMHMLVFQKFYNHPGLREKLLATGDAELTQRNTWGDTFWGVCNGVGENKLGQILMEVRSMLKKAKDLSVCS